ncbi:MAG: DUF4097 family beta strand repeat-containing protein [Pseudomonadota bacterium]|nr:DUF4097 family beta strand repeat-containing protein [Pseudomonadota bacterium]
MKNLIYSLALLLGSHDLWAVEDTKSFQIPYETTQRLKISGYKGDIELIPAKEAQSTRITITKNYQIPSGTPDDIEIAIKRWDPLVENRENQLQITFREPQVRDFWLRKDYQDLVPNFKIQIVGFNLPTEIYWWKGDIKTAEWKNSVHVTLQSGSVDLNKVEGESNINVQSGSIKMIQQKGNVIIQTYDAKVVASNIEGSIEIDNFVGPTSVDKVEGAVRLNSFSGRNKFNDVKGSLNFQLKVGVLDIDELDGSLRGENADGQVRAHLTGSPDVRIRSQGGGVNLSMSKKQSAHLNIGSVEGELRIPTNIKVQKGANMKWAVGKLRGGGEKEGQIFARSQSGLIGVNQK